MKFIEKKDVLELNLGYVRLGIGSKKLTNEGPVGLDPPQGLK